MSSGEVDAGYIAMLERRVLRYKALFEAADGLCAYCECELTYVIRPDGSLLKNTITRDHRLPRSSGGTTDADNIIAACSQCNTAKGQMTEDEFRRVIALQAKLVANAKGAIDIRRCAAEARRADVARGNTPR